MTMLDFTMVSQATRLNRSCARQASSTLSEIRSATLSGCPSPTDSEEKTNLLAIGKAQNQSRLPFPSKLNINACLFHDTSIFRAHPRCHQSIVFLPVPGRRSLVFALSPACPPPSSL